MTAAAICCCQYVENQVVDQMDAIAAWEWRMLNSLAIFTWLMAILGNELAAGPGAPFAERTNGIKMALRSRMDAVMLGSRFFCISASLRRVPVREGALSDCEAKWVTLTQ